MGTRNRRPRSTPSDCVAHDLTGSVTHWIINTLPPRSTAGQLTLDQHIGVRIPGGQPRLFNRFYTFHLALCRVKKTGQIHRWTPSAPDSGSGSLAPAG